MLVLPPLLDSIVIRIPTFRVLYLIIPEGYLGDFKCLVEHGINVLLKYNTLYTKILFYFLFDDSHLPGYPILLLLENGVC